MTTAIYYQKSEVVQEEFKLIEVATLREMCVEQLQRVLREVKERRRECDDAAILETFTLFNKVREATIDIIRSISVWQESFTKPLRPRLLDCDYIIDRLIYHIDFINATNLKRIFNFQFYRGNFLLLPYPNPKTVEPVRISTPLAREIRAFALPSEEKVLYCYQFMINCIPDAVYQDKVAPLKRWLMAGWVPRVWVMDAQPAAAPPAPRAATSKRHALPSAATPTGSRKGPVLESGGASGGPAHGPSSVSSLHPAANSNRSPNPSTPLNKRRSTIGSSNSSISKDRGKGKGGDEAVGASKTRMKRRNQMKEEETAQLKAIMVEATSPSAQAEHSSSAPDVQALQLAEHLRVQREKKEREISGLELYFQEMELLFTPALGRRAVQTVLVGGTRTDDDKEEYHEPITHELFHQPDKIVFHHTFQEERDQLEAIVAGDPVPEGSQRVNAALVTKRNRIMADRGQPTRDRTYEQHQQKQKATVDFSSYKRAFDRSTLLSTRAEVNPLEILFAASDPNQTMNKEAQGQSQKAAAAYLKNKYNTGSVRSRSRDSGDGGTSEAESGNGNGGGGGRGSSRRSSRRMSGATLDSFLAGGREDASAAGKLNISSSANSFPGGDLAADANLDEIPPPPADSPLSKTSATSSKLPVLLGTHSDKKAVPAVSSPPGSAKRAVGGSSGRNAVPRAHSSSAKTSPAPMRAQEKAAKAAARAVTKRTSAKGVPRAAVEEDTVGFEPDAHSEAESDQDQDQSKDQNQDQGAEEVAEAEARRMRRRESRRMSDLTVTFSVKSGEGDGEGTRDRAANDLRRLLSAGRAVGADADADDESEYVAEHLPPLGLDQGSPQRVRSANRATGGRQKSPHVSPPTQRPAGSPARSPMRGQGSNKLSTPTGRHASPSRTVTDSGGSTSKGGQAGRSRAGLSSDRSQAAASSSTSVRSGGTNEYGIKIKAGTPPKASLSLSLTTDAMRAMFAGVGASMN